MCLTSIKEEQWLVGEKNNIEFWAWYQGKHEFLDYDIICLFANDKNDKLKPSKVLAYVSNMEELQEAYHHFKNSMGKK